MMGQKEIDELCEILTRHEAYMYGDCERCKGGNKTTRGHRIILCGEFVTKLCPDCTRDWDVFCDATAEYKRWVFADHDKDAVMLLIKSGKDLRVDLTRAVGEEMKAKTEMYATAESWVKRTRER